MASTTILGSKPLKDAGDYLSEVRLTIPVSVEIAANDSESPQAVSSESGCL